MDTRNASTKDNTLFDALFVCHGVSSTNSQHNEKITVMVLSGVIMLDLLLFAQRIQFYYGEKKCKMAKTPVNTCR